MLKRKLIYSWDYIALFIALISSCYSFIYYFNPFFSTNDDTSMLWKVEGLGDHLGRVNTDIIFQSNILGILYDLIPDNFGVYGYANFIVAGIIVLLFCFYLKIKTKQSTWLIVLISFVFLFLYLSHLQFSVTSSVYFGIFYLLNSYQKNNKKIWIISYLFLLLAIFVRDFFIAYFIILFFILNFDFKKDKIINAVIVCTLISFSFLFKKNYIKDNSIARGFVQTQEKRLRLLDFKCAEHLEKNYHNIEKMKLSFNDIVLFKHWFQASNKIRKIIRSEEVISHCEKISFDEKIENGLFWLKEAFSLKIIFLSLFLIFTSFSQNLFSRRRVLLSLSIFSSFFIFGFLGRPPQTRVFLSVLTLFSLINFVDLKKNVKNNTIVIILLTGVFSQLIYPQLKLYRWRKNNYATEFEVINKSISSNPNAKIWWWAYGGNYVEWMYPIVKNDLNKDLQLYNLNHDWGDRDDPDFTKTPKYFEEGFTSTVGVSILFYDYIYEERGHWFNTYCKEHYGKDLKTKVYENKENEQSKLVVVNMSCI